jgi:hypothetical protein
MNVLRCQVKLSRVVQVDIPEHVVGNQSIEHLAILTARSQYGYDCDGEVLLVERSYVATAPNTGLQADASPESCDCDRSVIHDCVCPQCRERYISAAKANRWAAQVSSCRLL